jgi:RNase P/RNase MRP subunit POP5
MWLKWKLVLVLLEIVLIFTQDRCTVCVVRATGSKIVWTHLMKLLGDVGLMEAHFFPFRDSVRAGAR